MVKILRTDISKVHTEIMVGPVDMDFSSEENLRQSYKRCIKEARNRRVKSISFPVFLDGEELSKEDCMRIAIEETCDYANSGADVILVFPGERYSELDYALMERLKDYVYNYYTAVTSNVRAANISSMVRSESNLRRATSFSEYLSFLYQSYGLTSEEVAKRAIMTEEEFEDIINDVTYHPTKTKALRLCVASKLSLQDTKDLLARGGYTLSPCDKNDIILSFFIENNHHDLIDINFQLEEYGLNSIFS